MISPEREILQRLLDRLAKLNGSACIDVAAMAGTPDDLAAFDAMSPQRQSASRAFLKSFEQIEDQLARAFRVIPRLLGEDSGRWFARDHADYMERFGVLDDAGDWSNVVKLRNQLVHDYPLDPQVQFERLIAAVTYLPLLTETHRRLVAFVQNDLPGKML